MPSIWFFIIINFFNYYYYYCYYYYYLQINLFKIIKHLFIKILFQNEPDLGLKMILATKEVYKSSIAHLRPTPNKSHYLLNLRDFSRVINGLLLIPKEKCSSWPTMIRSQNNAINLIGIPYY